jgi:hypothetical protein
MSGVQAHLTPRRSPEDLLHHRSWVTQGHNQAQSVLGHVERGLEVAAVFVRCWRVTTQLEGFSLPDSRPSCVGDTCPSDADACCCETCLNPESSAKERQRPIGWPRRLRDGVDARRLAAHVGRRSDHRAHVRGRLPIRRRGRLSLFVSSGEEAVAAFRRVAIPSAPHSTATTNPCGGKGCAVKRRPDLSD